jgi:hypothetical protein
MSATYAEGIRRPCANCHAEIVLRPTNRSVPGRSGWAPFEPLSGERHYCGLGKVRTRTFDELNPEERRKLGIPYDWKSGGKGPAR